MLNRNSIFVQELEEKKENDNRFEELYPPAKFYNFLIQITLTKTTNAKAMDKENKTFKKS